MSILTISAGKVSAVRGEAYIRTPEGDLIQVVPGTPVEPGQAILSASGELIEVVGDATEVTLVEAPLSEMDDAISALNGEASEEFAPAAGLTGGEGGALGMGLRVDRVSESVRDLAFEYGTELGDREEPVWGSGSAGNQVSGLPPVEPPVVPPEPPLTDKPSLRIDSNPAIEGQPVEFALRLSGPTEGDLVIKLDVLAGSADSRSATPGVDTGNLSYFDVTTDSWRPVTGDLTLPAGSTELRVRLETVDDLEIEGTEWIGLKATVLSGNTFNDDASNDAPIIDNDKPYLQVGSEPTIEGSPVEFRVFLTGPANGDVVVKLDVLAGHPDQPAATPGTDTGSLSYFDEASNTWLPVTGDLTLPEGTTELRVRLDTVDDLDIEGTEWIGLKASVVSGDTANTEAVNDAPIIDNDKPYLQVGSEPAMEGSPVEFRVFLTGPANGDVIVKLDVLAGSADQPAATPGTDTGSLSYFDEASNTWLPVTGDLTLPEGTTELRVRLETVDDSDIEGTEWIGLKATVVSGDTANTEAVNDAPIIDNDIIKPYVVVYAEPAVEGEYAQFKVQLTTPSSEAVTAQMSLRPGLDAPVDFNADLAGQLEYLSDAATGTWSLVTGPLTFQPGEQEILFRVATQDDDALETIENLQLHVEVIAGQVENPVTWNDVAIIDNESHVVEAGGNDGEFLEGQAGNDRIEGGQGDDFMAGGRGSDVLIGGAGADVFYWTLSDAVGQQTPVDRIEDFDVKGGDQLHLADLLQGEHGSAGDIGNLDQFLQFDTSGADTVINVSANGIPGEVVQQIVLQGVNLRAAFDLAADASDGDVIAKMLSEHKLVVDA